MIKFDVTNRFTGKVQFTAEIECAESESTSIKLGLAVRWAVKTRAYLAGANLAGAYLARANLAGAYLARANLAGAYLARANLAGAYLARANLAGANLDGANLAGAYLARANLAGANLDGANLAGANLDGANLAGANLAGAVKIIRLLASAIRLIDQYQFFLWQTEGGHIITAGCRTMTIADYRKHITEEYPDTQKSAETADILDFFEVRLSRIGAEVKTEDAA